MIKEELIQEIADKVNEIRELYYKEYPQGHCLSIEIGKNGISFCNIFYDEDIDFPIDYSEYIFIKEKE